MSESDSELTDLGMSLEAVRSCLGITQDNMAQLMGAQSKASYRAWIYGRAEMRHSAPEELVRAGLNPGFLHSLKEPMLTVDADTFRSVIAKVRAK